MWEIYLEALRNKLEWSKIALLYRSPFCFVSRISRSRFEVLCNLNTPRAKHTTKKVRQKTPDWFIQSSVYDWLPLTVNCCEDKRLRKSSLADYNLPTSSFSIILLLRVVSLAPKSSLRTWNLSERSTFQHNECPQKVSFRLAKRKL